MTFAHLSLLWFLPVALLVAVAAIVAEVRRRRALRVLGDRRLVEGLRTFDASARRVVKNGLLLVAVVLVVVAAARPRYGKGTKIVPAADVTAMVALDVSKSMYARDISPSRLERARSDAARMIKDLPMIRWGAVAFAGEAVAFPPTTDAPEAAQFLRAHEPYEMPGGTALAKAIELARRHLLPEASDGKGATRKKNEHLAIVLITDGDDLEGDPVEAARQAAADGITIHVVSVGSRAPQKIPDIDPDSGVARGYIRDEQGVDVTTDLSPEAEEHLRAIAREGGGRFVEAEAGATGIATIEGELRALISKEGTERVETLFADVYQYPLGVAALLLLLELFVSEAPGRRRRAADRPSARKSGTQRVAERRLGHA